MQSIDDMSFRMHIYHLLAMLTGTNSVSKFTSFKHQILLKMQIVALQMQQINLLIFDECHHAKKNHPYNCIMKEFYFTTSVSPSACSCLLMKLRMQLIAKEDFYTQGFPSFALCSVTHILYVCRSQSGPISSE